MCDRTVGVLVFIYLPSAYILSKQVHIEGYISRDKEFIVIDQILISVGKTKLESTEEEDLVCN